MRSLRSTGALAQYRREMEAGLRTANEPTDTLWSAAWRELAAQCWRLKGHPARATALSLDSARIIVLATQRRRST